MTTENYFTFTLGKEEVLHLVIFKDNRGNFFSFFFLQLSNIFFFFLRKLKLAYFFVLLDVENCSLHFSIFMVTILSYFCW